MKITAFGSRYFTDGWNIFDFVIVLGSMTGIVIGLSSEQLNRMGPVTTLVRSFRILRIFKLFRKSKNIRIISQTFILTLPAMINVGSLLILLLYMYSILGVFLFAEVKWTNQLGPYVNFTNIGVASLTLLRASTGENWQEVIYSIS